MTRMSSKRLFGAAAFVIGLIGAATPAAQAQDFFATLFGGMSGEHMPDLSMPFAHEGAPPPRVVRPRAPSGGPQAFCVRTCDGRYFPISASDNQSRAASCNSFCPAAKTEVVYGSSIDHATTEKGRAYSDLPNAFKFRNEIVAGCTCNGKDQFGLAQVKIEDDPTLRKGDIVASADGLKSIARTDKRGASLNMSPVPVSISAKYERLSVMARE